VGDQEKLATEELNGRIALVTGAARGIGLGVAERLAQHGATVVLSDIDEEELERSASSLREQGLEATGIPADMSRGESIAGLFDRIANSHGAVELLVNNAGRIVIKPFLDHTDEDWASVLSVNLTAAYLCCQHAIRGMLEQNKRGAIVNVSSIGGFHVTATHAGYTASKAALVALTRELAYEFGPSGIRANAIAPAGIASRMTTGSSGSGLIGDELTDSIVSSIRLGRRGQPTEVGDLVAFLLSDRASFITGTTVTISGGAELKVFNS
jgi:3-oxoacyl-[acyl-carrier protein] reductase